jgi:hypothetical protein
MVQARICPAIITGRITGRIAAKIAGRTGSLNPETLRRWIERSFIGSVAGSGGEEDRRT